MKKYIKGITFLVLIIFLISSQSFSLASAQWNIKYDDVEFIADHIAYGNGLFVEVGNGGMIKTSSDGKNWTIQKYKTDGKVYGSIYGVYHDPIIYNLIFADKKFVFLSGESIFTSTDGIKWTKVYTNNKLALYDITYKSNTFVSYSGKEETYYYSKDLKNWKSAKGTKYMPTSKDELIFDGSYYYKCKNQYYNFTIYKSKDGIKWSKCYEKKDAFGNLQYLNKTFYINMNGILYSSKNFKTMTKCVFSDNTPLKDYIREFSSNGKIIVGIGNSTYTSKDGIVWKAYPNGNAYSFTSTASNGKNVVLVNLQQLVVLQDGKYKEICSSIDSSDYSITYHRAYYINDKYFVSWGNQILVSSDGLSWTTVDDVSAASIIWDGNNYLAYSNSMIYKSTDGITWIKFKTSITDKKDSTGLPVDTTQLNQLAYLNGNYFLAGTGNSNSLPERPVLLESKDLLNWELTSDDFFKSDLNQAFLDNIEVINGELIITISRTYYHELYGYIYSSKDGDNWAAGNGVGGEVSKIAYDGTYYVCISYDYEGHMEGYMISKDGKNWSHAEFPVDGYLNDVTYDGSQFIFVGNNGLIVKGNP